MRIAYGSVLMVCVVGCAAAGGQDVEVVRRPLAEGETPAIRFGADWSVVQEGDLVAGKRVLIDYDPARLPDCRGDRYGQPAWRITGWNRIDGSEPTPFLVAPDLPGPAMDPEPWIDLTTAGELEIWFQITSVWGCSEWDSDFGHNYRFSVEPPPGAPSWMGGEVSAITRRTCADGPCPDDLRPLSEGFSFDTAARQRAEVAALFFRVWEPGVTDRDDPDLWRALDTRIHYRFGSEGPFAWRWVDLDGRAGNDARYAVDLRTELDPFVGDGCPDVPLRATGDGRYVEAEVTYYFTVNGAPLRPRDGEAYRGTFQDYAGRYAACPE